MKLKPNVPKASRPPHAMAAAVPASRSSTNQAAPAVTRPNSLSAPTPRVSIVAPSLTCQALFDRLADIGLDLLDESRRQRHVIELLRLRLALAERPFEEAQCRVGPRLVLR